MMLRASRVLPTPTTTVQLLSKAALPGQICRRVLSTRLVALIFPVRSEGYQDSGSATDLGRFHLQQLVLEEVLGRS